MSTPPLGMPTNRVDGPVKVTGAAKYAADFQVSGLCYGYIVASPIAKGRITAIHADEVLTLPGVLAVFSHLNRPALPADDDSYQDSIAPGGSPFRPFYDANILFSQQPVACVVADTFELARYAASVLRVDYEKDVHHTNLDEQRAAAFPPEATLNGFFEPPPSRGKPDAAWAEAPHRVEGDFVHKTQHHNPMELFATTVEWHGDNNLTIYDKTQATFGSQQYICNVFGLTKEQAHVVSYFTGGAFGVGLRPQCQLFMAVLAALDLKRSVRVALTRQQMFGLGYRPMALQQVKLGAGPDGTLTALHHSVLQPTSPFENYAETIVNWSGQLYECANVKLDHQIARLNLCTPATMRAPGPATGSFALEVALDELAYELNMDPIDLRLRNYAERNPVMDKPFSSKSLRECYRQGADRFGWDRRSPEPRSMRVGNRLIGWGMAGGMWDAQQSKATAKATFTADGKLTIASGVSGDIGGGTATIMVQVAADTLGVPMELITFVQGDTTLPEAPVQGGSWTAGSVGTAVKVVCEALGKKLLDLAQQLAGSPVRGAAFADVMFADGYVRLRSNPALGVDLRRVLIDNGLPAVEVEATSLPDAERQATYSLNVHNAVFAEVEVDEELGTVRVIRVVEAMAAGRIFNPKTAASQIRGAAVQAIGTALMEETIMDHRFGRFMNHNLAEYHIPVNADIHSIEVLFVDEQDDVVNGLGGKGVGEIGIVGVAAAITNAVYHATGKRIRELPITRDKLL